MNIPNLKSWPSDKEKELSDFGDAYLGYYVDIDNVRYVMYARVKDMYRNKGFFTILMDALKKDVDAVALDNPTDITVNVSMKCGYKFDDVYNRMVWRK